MTDHFLSNEQETFLLGVLHERFTKNMHRHPHLTWEEVEVTLKSQKQKLRSLAELENTGGEPDVIIFADDPEGICFIDCSPESPLGRRSLCYDRMALDARKENKPKGAVSDMLEQWGIELLSECEYRELQKYGNFDTKTSSWIKTPSHIRNLGGALFCDRRYDTVFTYHNGADSYYAARGFRTKIRL